nr:MFS transporter [Actinomycetales bacterium]
MPTTSQNVWRTGNALLVIALVAMAIHLRPGATAIGPVLSELQESLGFGSTFAGLLTALPGLGFAIVGIFASGLGARIGISRALTLSLAAVAVGLSVRAFATEPWGFLAFTFLAIAGMAVGNVLVPPFIKANFGLHTARMTSAYTVALAVGATLPTALTGWLMTFPGEWRAALGVWGTTAALALFPWIAVLFWDQWAESRGLGDPVVDPPVRPRGARSEAAGGTGADTAAVPQPTDRTHTAGEGSDQGESASSDRTHT